MTKNKVIKEISGKTGIERVIVEATVEAFMLAVKEHIANKEVVNLRGFGTFSAKRRAAKIGRNISKNTEIHIPAHYIPAFKPSKKFVEKVKQSIGQ